MNKVKSMVLAALITVVAVATLAGCMSGMTLEDRAYEAGRIATFAYVYKMEDLAPKDRANIEAVYQAFDAALDEVEADKIPFASELINKELDKKLTDPELNKAAKMLVAIYWGDIERKFNIKEQVPADALVILMAFRSGIEDAWNDLGGGK